MVSPMANKVRRDSAFNAGVQTDHVAVIQAFGAYLVAALPGFSWPLFSSWNEPIKC